MRILIVDDNIDIIDLMVPHFIKEGYEIDIAKDGLEALDKFNSKHDLVLLDIMMPKLDGISVCKKIREKSSVPIIMITAKSSDEDVIEGLDIGADDYIVKPFSPRQVVAKVKAMLRRLKVEKNILKRDNLFIDMDSYIVRLNEQVINLTKKEIELLYLLVSHPKRVYTREILLDTLWGEDYLGDIRTVDTHIKRLRAKLNKYPHNFDIETVWGVGYKYEDVMG